jgi:cell wall-associated protease
MKVVQKQSSKFNNLFAKMSKTIGFVLVYLVLVGCNDAKTRPPRLNPDADTKGDIKEEVIEKSLEMWHLSDPMSGFEGIGLNRVSTPQKPNDEQEIVVAVIDSGVEITHPALKNKIWTNEKEIPGNGIDDDGNGYIDDVHGWNFLGGTDGKNIDDDTLEVTREAARYDKKIAAGEILSEAEIEYFEAAKKDHAELLAEATNEFEKTESVFQALQSAQLLLVEKLNLADFNKETLEKIESTDSDVLEAKKIMLQVVKDFRSIARYYRFRYYYDRAIKFSYNKNFEPYKEIVKNDETDFSEFNFGNNDVTGPDADHGTHVAGIIAAEASQSYLARGISQNVKIMVLRAVPNGDEHDKGVVASIRYAVANGAKIINMSFGKAYSPYKAEVDKAFLLAAKAGVLIVHAAGNSSFDLDTKNNFPNRKLVNSSVLSGPAEIDSWLEVGASGPFRGLDLLAVFSNYGSKTVDLFAPGVDILSSVTGHDYAMYSGTSMASPVVAGSAALLMNRHKEISAKQTREIILDQVRSEYPRARLPGSQTFDVPVYLKSISITGGLLDLDKSSKLAEQLSP